MALLLLLHGLSMLHPPELRSLYHFHFLFPPAANGLSIHGAERRLLLEQETIEPVLHLQPTPVISAAAWAQSDPCARLAIRSADRMPACRFHRPASRDTALSRCVPLLWVLMWIRWVAASRYLHVLL